MSGEPLNPYASPVIPDESHTRQEPRGIVVQFKMDAETQRISAANCGAPVPAWIYWTAPLWLIGLGFVMIAAVANLGSLGGMVVLIAVFSVSGMIQMFRNRHVARQQQIRLQAHPVLGVLGDWKLTATRDELVVETPGGTQSFPRATTPLLALEGVELVIWFEGDLPITIPERGSNAKMCRVLRYWLIKTTAKPVTAG